MTAKPAPNLQRGELNDGEAIHVSIHTGPGRGTRDAAGGTRRTHARKHTSSRGHTQERKHAIIVSHSLSRHAGHAPRAREPLTRRAATAPQGPPWAVVGEKIGLRAVSRQPSASG